MAQLNRQEVQRLLDTTRNQILDRVLTRQDLCAATDAIRDRLMNYMQDLTQVQQMNIVRRTAQQSDELNKRIATLETRIASMEHEVKATLQLVQRSTIQQQSPPAITFPKQEKNYTHTPEQRYVYGVN